jgi:hypothetical protein
VLKSKECGPHIIITKEHEATRTSDSRKQFLGHLQYINITQDTVQGKIIIGIVGGGVQLGPLGTAATNRPIVPAPGEFDDGEIGGMISRGNRNTRRKPVQV